MADGSDLPDFTPAPSRRTIAGWTPARQHAFVAAIAVGHGVRDAAAGVGLSARSAYHLRRSAGGADFAAAWDVARAMGDANLDETALGRVLGGERRTVFYRGAAVGERVVFDNGLLIRLLKLHDSRLRRKGVER